MNQPLFYCVRVVKCLANCNTKSCNSALYSVVQSDSCVEKCHMTQWWVLPCHCYHHFNIPVHVSTRYRVSGGQVWLYQPQGRAKKCCEMFSSEKRCLCLSSYRIWEEYLLHSFVCHFSIHYIHYALTSSIIIIISPLTILMLINAQN